MRQYLSLLIAASFVSLSLVSPVLAVQPKMGVLHLFSSLPATLGGEGLAIHGGHFYVGTFTFVAADGTILVLDKDGSVIQRFTVPGLPQVGQIAFPDDRSFFAVAGNIPSGTGSVIRVELDSGKVTTFATGFKTPNGLAIDRKGNLWVTDILAGTVSKVTPDGKVSLFSSDSLLAPVLIAQAGISLGANDLVLNRDQTSLYVSNVGQGTIVKIDIRSDGSAGPATKFASIPTPDGEAFDVRGNLYVTSPFTNSVWTVAQDGTTHILTFNTTNANLSNPSNLAFRGRQLYITNLGLTIGSTNIEETAAQFPGLPL